MGLLVKPALPGRRDKKASLQVAAPQDDSFLSAPLSPALLSHAFLSPPPFDRERLGKTVRGETRRLLSLTKVSFKIRGTSPRLRQR